MAFSDKVQMGAKGRAQAYGDYYNATAKTPGASPSTGGSKPNPLQTYGGTKGTPYERYSSKSPFIKKQDEETDEDPRQRALRRRLKRAKKV